MIDLLESILRQRSLLGVLVVRELKARYRGSILGFLWSLAQPLVLLGVYSLVFGQIFLHRIQGAVEPYPVFLICGLFPWIWFSSSLSEATVSLVSNAGLIRRAVFPVEILPLVPVFSQLVHFVLALPVVALGLAWARQQGLEVGGAGLVALPAVMALFLLATAGLALLLAALHAHFKDVRDLLTSVLTVLFFLTPILYTPEAVPEPFGRLLWLSPATPFVLSFQDVLFRGVFPAPERLFAMSLLAALFLVVGLEVFRRLRDSFVEVV